MIILDPAQPILVVDDEASDRMIISAIIERSDLRNKVEQMASGQALLDYMDKVSQNAALMPALILLDINMPALSGFDTVTRLRQMDAFREQPLIAMLTSSDAASDQLEANRSGANIFLTKPSGVAKFLALINGSFANPELAP